MYLLYDPETTFGTNIQAQCEKFSLYKHFSNITAEVLEVRFCWTHLLSQQAYCSYTLFQSCSIIINPQPI